MYAFIAALPVWFFILAGVAIGYLIYRIWTRKKASPSSSKVDYTTGLTFLLAQPEPSDLRGPTR
jgi:hypothetical protein